MILKGREKCYLLSMVSFGKGKGRRSLPLPEWYKWGKICLFFVECDWKCGILVEMGFLTVLGVVSFEFFS